MLRKNVKMHVDRMVIGLSKIYDFTLEDLIFVTRGEEFVLPLCISECMQSAAFIWSHNFGLPETSNVS
jgi:hypothetical protein